MKNIFKFSISLLALIILGSCTNDKDAVASAKGFELRAPGLVPTVVLTSATKNNVVATLEWDKSDNGVPAVANYKVQIAKSGTNFADPVTANSNVAVLVTPESRTYSIKGLELNTMMYQLSGVECGQATNIEIRIVSILGLESANPFIQYSTNTISMNVTPYTNDLPILAFSSSSAQTDLENAPKLASSSADNSDNYEGYMYLEPGTYKFYKPDPCNKFATTTVYGINSGALVQDGTNGYTVATAGHYFIRVNLSNTDNTIPNITVVPAMSYVITPYTSFGIFGAAKGAPTGNNRPMTYDVAAKTWKLTFELFKGRKFKFRSVATATPVTVLGTTLINVPGENPLTEFALSAANGDIKVPGTDDATKQKYDIVLNVSNPRVYTYTLTLNPN